MSDATKQTAIEWFAENFSQHLEEYYNIKITNLTLLKQAKELEKNQIKTAYLFGYTESKNLKGDSFNLAEEYYNEIYQNNI